MSTALSGRFGGGIHLRPLVDEHREVADHSGVVGDGEATGHHGKAAVKDFWESGRSEE